MAACAVVVIQVWKSESAFPFSALPKPQLSQPPLRATTSTRVEPGQKRKRKEKSKAMRDTAGVGEWSSKMRLNPIVRISSYQAVNRDGFDPDGLCWPSHIKRQGLFQAPVPPQYLPRCSSQNDPSFFSQFFPNTVFLQMPYEYRSPQIY